MHPEEFIKAIRVINAAAMKGLIQSFEDPPGRTPAPNLLRVSNFLKKLNEEDREVFLEALQIAADDAFYSFFLVLDGLLAFEPVGPKGRLDLIYDNGISRILLNDPDFEPLSALFKSED